MRMLPQRSVHFLAFTAFQQLVSIACAIALVGANSANAHVVLDQRTAQASSYFRGAFRVGHGCDGSPVIAITINLPEGVRGAKPMSKPGWTIERQIARLAKPYDAHGKSVTEDVTAITWRGGLLPDAGGT